MTFRSALFNITGFLFFTLFLAIGIVNTFWGNDPGLGVGCVALSFLYLPPVNTLVTQKTGIVIPVAIKIILALLLLWITLGVGELFNKIDMMIMDLK